MAAHLGLLGAIYSTVGRKEEAARALAADLAFDPTDDAIYVNLGRLALSGGDGASTIEWFAEAVMVDPHSSAASEGLAQATLGSDR